jgi:hypothetical protein
MPTQVVNSLDPRLTPQHADAVTTLSVISNELLRRRCPDAAPEARYTADVLGGPVDNVMQSDDPTGAHEFAVQLEVPANTLGCVVAVDEQKINLAAAELPLDMFERTNGVRVADKEMDTLSVQRKSSEERSAATNVATRESTIGSRREIHGNESRVWCSDAREQK